MVPTYLRRRPGSTSNGHLGSALFCQGFGDFERDHVLSRHPKAALRRQALERRRARRSRHPRRASAARLAEVGLVSARARWRPRVVAAFSADPRRTRSPLALLAAFATRRFRHSSARNRRARRAARLPPVAGRRAAGRGRDGRPGAQARRRRRSSRTCCSCRSPLSIGRATASATAPAATTARSSGCAPAVRSAPSASPTRSAEVPAAPAEAHDERLDFILTEREWIVAPGAG